MMSSIVCRDHARKTPSGPGEVQQGPGVSNSDYGPLSVLRSVRRSQQGHQAPYEPGFLQEVLRPQAGAGRDTIVAWGWPTVGNRCTTATSKAPQLIYKY